MLLTLPEELLVQHILVRLNLPTLESCLSTCRHLNHTIKSSPLINYSVELQKLNLIDNPALSFDDIPLNKRFDMLKEHRERAWGVIWKTSAGVLNIDMRIMIEGDAGVVYRAPYDRNIDRLRWTILPSKEDQKIRSKEFCMPNPATVVALALSIEENDLLAFAIWQDKNVGDNMLSMQVNLVQHSVQLPYPGLPSPILDICTFQRRHLESLHTGIDHPLINLAIRGTNLAVMVGHTIYFGQQVPLAGHLSVWNWKTGEKRWEKLFIPDTNMSLLFLRDDILLHGSIQDMALDIYHLPSSASSTGPCKLRLIRRLGLPPVNRTSPGFYFSMSFADNPTAFPSFMESSNPTTPRLFTADPASSILAIDMEIEVDSRVSSFLLITHYSTLLGLADRALSGEGVEVQTLGWMKWGPEMTRMFWCKPWPSESFTHEASCGSRLIRKYNNVIEVYDFDPTGHTNDTLQDRQSRGDFLGSLDEGDAFDSGSFLEFFQTKLPYTYQTFKGSDNSSDLQWDTMYVDQSRIVGFDQSRNSIDVLYIGGKEGN